MEEEGRGKVDDESGDSRRREMGRVEVESGEWGKRALLSNFLRVTNISITHDFFFYTPRRVFFCLNLLC